VRGQGECEVCNSLTSKAKQNVYLNILLFYAIGISKMLTMLPSITFPSAIES